MTDPIAYLVVKPDGSVSRYEQALGMEQAQAIVGGDFEALPAPVGVAVTLLAATEAKQHGEQPNWAATRIIRNRIRPDDFVAGAVIVAGAPNEEGELTSLTSEAEKRVREVIAP